MDHENQNKTIAVIIPAYEPDQHLVSLVHTLLKKSYQIIVVNDGSSAHCDPIFNQINVEGVTLLTHSQNLGKGEALKTAFTYVVDHLPNCIGVVTADADGQHLPSDIVRVADVLIQQPQHLILGCRKFSGHVPLRSKLGNTVTRGIFAALIGKKISDTQTGLRGIPRFILPKLIKIRSHGYEFELEMLIHAVQHPIPITQIDIATVYENNNACSHFNPLFDSVKIYFVFLRFLSLGLLTAGVDLLVFTLSFMFSNMVFLSECLARSSGGLFSFVVGKHLIFKSKSRYTLEMVKFFALWLMLLLTSYVMITGAHALGLNIYLSKITTQTLLFLASFSIQRLFVFTYKPESSLAQD